jgi:hypothetical protein
MGSEISDFKFCFPVFVSVFQEKFFPLRIFFDILWNKSRKRRTDKRLDNLSELTSDAQKSVGNTDGENVRRCFFGKQFESAYDTSLPRLHKPITNEKNNPNNRGVPQDEVHGSANVHGLPVRV